VKLSNESLANQRHQDSINSSEQNKIHSEQEGFSASQEFNKSSPRVHQESNRRMDHIKAPHISAPDNTAPERILVITVSIENIEASVDAGHSELYIETPSAHTNNDENSSQVENPNLSQEALDEPEIKQKIKKETSNSSFDEAIEDTDLSTKINSAEEFSIEKENDVANFQQKKWVELPNTIVLKKGDVDSTEIRILIDSEIECFYAAKKEKNEKFQGARVLHFESCQPKISKDRILEVFEDLRVEIWPAEASASFVIKVIE
jgi:hypothetical protein